MTKKKNVRDIIATNLKRIRTEQNLTQAQLAELANLSNTYIANIECGKTWISDTTLEKLSTALNTDFHVFFISDTITKKIESSSINSLIQKYKKQALKNDEEIFKALQIELHKN